MVHYLMIDSVPERTCTSVEEHFYQNYFPLPQINAHIKYSYHRRDGMVQRDRSKIFDILAHTKVDEEVLYATILRATDKASVEKLKAKDTYVNYGQVSSDIFGFVRVLNMPFFQDVTFPQRKLDGGSPLYSLQFCVRWTHV